MNSPQRQYYLLALLGTMLTAIIMLKMGIGITKNIAGHWIVLGQDFFNYWAAPQIANQHIGDLMSYESFNITLDRLAPDQATWDAATMWSYPLHSLFFYGLFSSMPLQASLALWLVLGLLVYASMGMRLLGTKHRLAGMTCLLCAPACLINIYTRQNGLFLGAASLGVLWLMQQQRPYLAGILLGCLTIKPQLFLLWPLMLLLQGSWRTILAASLTTIILVGSSLAVHGVAAWQDYLTYAPQDLWNLLASLSLTEKPPLHSLMMPNLIVSLRLLGLSPDLATGSHIIVALGVMMVACLALRRSLTLGQRALILALGGLLVTPYAFNYDMAFLSAALLIRCSESPPTSTHMRWLYGLTYLAPSAVYVLNSSGLPLLPLLLLGFFIATLREALQSPPANRPLS